VLSVDGLKGSLNEYELDLLRQRSVEARHQKARHGELLISAPVGYVKSEENRLEKNPDRRVQETIALVFRKFLELGTVRQTQLWFLEHELQLPAHNARGELICLSRSSSHDHQSGLRRRLLLRGNRTPAAV
jgi:DNA invertase Pin-like site-specific DNA recombinase